jgi:hypothetical protein
MCRLNWYWEPKLTRPDPRLRPNISTALCFVVQKLLNWSYMDKSEYAYFGVLVCRCSYRDLYIVCVHTDFCIFNGFWRHPALNRHCSPSNRSLYFRLLHYVQLIADGLVHHYSHIGHVRKRSCHVCLSVHPTAWNNSAPTHRIFIKFDIWGFFSIRWPENSSLNKIRQE